MMRVGYILGRAYCGSTLLSALLDGHPEVVSAGELGGPIVATSPDYPCSCGEPLVDCPFWRDVVEEMEREGVPFDLSRWNTLFELYRTRMERRAHSAWLAARPLGRARGWVLTNLPATPRWTRIARVNRALLRALVSVSGKEVVVDAAKSPSRFLDLVRMKDLDLRVVHLVRDAPGTVVSSMRNANASLASTLRSWNRAVNQAEAVRQVTEPSRFLRIRYEDLCRDPSRELDRIAALLEVDAFPKPVLLSPAQHHLIGNRMRLGASTDIRLDEKWRDELSEAQMDRILSGTAAHRALLGYPEDPRTT